MLKEQLLEEAQNLDASVELDSVFEAVELSDEVKENFSTVFETSVKMNAVKLAEQHINAIAESAEAKVQELVEAKTAEIEATLNENTQKFLEHLGEQWLTENKVAITKDIKAGLFESMLSGMRDLFVEHNVVVPDESVDIVAEMESELAESKDAVSTLFDESVKLKKVINEMNRNGAIQKATSELTESQKEKVESLVEGIQFNESFDGKLNSIVSMVKGSVKQEVKAPIVENVNIEFQPETIVESTPAKPEDSINKNMQAYINYSK